MAENNPLDEMAEKRIAYAMSHLDQYTNATDEKFSVTLARGLKITFYVTTNPNTATLLCSRTKNFPAQAEITLVRSAFHVAIDALKTTAYVNGHGEHIISTVY